MRAVRQRLITVQVNRACMTENVSLKLMATHAETAQLVRQALHRRLKLNPFHVMYYECLLDDVMNCVYDVTKLA